VGRETKWSKAKMPIYKKSGGKLQPIKEKAVDLELTIQKLVEENLREVFGLTYVRSEYQLHNLRIDTLAFDEDQKSFVIIEYKRDRNFSVIDQGYAYLALLLNNKADFILEYNEKCQGALRRTDVDWSQSRVIFVASAFTKYQQEAMGFKDLPIELWEVKEFENDTILLNQLRASEKSETIRTIQRDHNTEVVTKEIRKYSVEDHFKPRWEKTRAIYDLFAERMMDLDPRFAINPKKVYIGFNINGKNVVNVQPKASKILLDLLRVQPEDLNDPEKRTRYMNHSYDWYHQHVTQFDIKNQGDVEYAIMLAKQVLKRFIG
jgi:predicted transport protein